MVLSQQSQTYVNAAEILGELGDLVLMPLDDQLVVVDDARLPHLLLPALADGLVQLNAQRLDVRPQLLPLLVEPDLVLLLDGRLLVVQLLLRLELLLVLLQLLHFPITGLSHQLPGDVHLPASLGQRDPEVLQNPLEVEHPELALELRQESQRHLEQNLHPVEQEHVENVEHEVEREAGGEHGEEPLAGKHVRLDAVLLEVVVQLGQLVLYQPIQLIQMQIEILESVLVEISESVVVHQRDEDAERVFLGHLRKERSS